MENSPVEAFSHQTLHERAIGRPNESGLGSIGALLTAATIGGAALFGLGMGAGDYARRNPVLTTHEQVQGGHGTVTYAGNLAIPESCYSVFESDIQDVKATYNQTVKLPFIGTIPTTNSASTTFNGNLTNKVCNPMMDLKVVYSNGKANVTLPLNELTTDVYRTDPLSTPFTHDNGFVMALRRNTENGENVIPGVKANGVNVLYGKLDDYAELSADEISTKVCGPKAWPYLQPLYMKDIKNQLIKEASRWQTGLNITASDITINTIGEIKMTNQYEKQLQDLHSANGGNDINVTIPNLNNVKCVLKIGKYSNQPSSAQQGAN